MLVVRFYFHELRMKFFAFLIGLVGGSALPKDPASYIQAMVDGVKTRDDVYLEYKARFGSDSIKWEDFVHYWHQANSWTQEEAIDWLKNYRAKHPQISREDAYDEFDRHFGPTPVDIYTRLWRRSRLEDDPTPPLASPPKTYSKIVDRNRMEWPRDRTASESARKRRLDLIRENFDPKLSGAQLFKKLLPIMKEAKILVGFRSFLLNHSAIRQEKGLKRQYTYKSEEQKEWIFEQLKKYKSKEVYGMLQEKFGSDAMSQRDFQISLQGFRNRFTYHRDRDGSKKERQAIRK
jgi:hypothetical protein